MVAFILLKYLRNIVYYIACNFFHRIFLTVYLYFRYTPIMFEKDFSDLIKAEAYVPKQVFTGNETGLFWKKLPNRTFTTDEEKASQDHKPI